VLFAGQIRTSPSDFVVTEKLSIEFSNDGEHDWLWIEKTGANTAWVAERLAHHASIPLRDVGYAGLKDRHAVTQQWFSVRRSGAGGTDWEKFDAEGVRIVERRVHQRKLRRGAHKGNGFRIAVRGNDVVARRAAIDERMACIKASGVPNYFGEQRFGRDGSNIELGRSLFQGRRLPRNKRSIAISAVRSFLFNEILATRVRDGSWDRILPGELANLDGSGSVFAVDELTPELEKRCATFDIHPTASLWGSAAPCGSRHSARLQTTVAAQHEELCAGLANVGVAAASRALRLRVQDLRWEIEDGALWLEFSLRKGSYATAVLREIVEL
jgi:tRNA pseudouridine13 synthase